MLRCRASGIIGSAPGLVCPVSVICDYCEIESVIYNFCLDVATRTIVWADPSLKYSRDFKQATNHHLVPQKTAVLLALQQQVMFQLHSFWGKTVRNCYLLPARRSGNKNQTRLQPKTIAALSCSVLGKCRRVHGMQMTLLSQLAWVIIDVYGATRVCWLARLLSRQVPATNARVRVPVSAWLEFSGFSMRCFLKLLIKGFLRVLRFSPHFHRLMVKINEISALADRIVGLVVKASASRAGGPGFESR